MTSGIDALVASTILAGTMTSVHAVAPGEPSPRPRTYLEFVEPSGSEPAAEDLDFGLRLLEARREPLDDPIFRSLEGLLKELAEERTTAPPPTEYDRVDERIVLSTFRRSLSPPQISRSSGVPITKVYRRLRKLEGLGLVKHVRTVMVTHPTRKRVKLYRTNVEKVKLLADRGTIRLGIKFRRVASRPPKLSIRLDPLPTRA